jgi:pimeloyl-ACP methyl ester carboxylesterase
VSEAGRHRPRADAVQDQAGRGAGGLPVPGAVSKVESLPVRALGPSASQRPPDGTGGSDRLVVVLPGLGMTRYLRRLVHELTRHGATPALLDLPGYGSPGGRATAPDVHAIGHAAAQWVQRCGAGREVVLLGHSTGAQAALTAALDLQDLRSGLALVLAGPTFAPAERRWSRLLAHTLPAYRHDAPWQLDPRELLRAGPADLVALVRSGLRDQPERRIRNLRVPVTVTAGHHDTYAPTSWLDLLASSAVLSPRASSVVLGGSHNNPWTHSAVLAHVALDTVTTADGPTPEPSAEVDYRAAERRH